jgi:L-ascorbate metabolism protein UlaG (beta-lactamase superfamily)
MGVGGLGITWHGHACFEIETPGGVTIVFDPWFANPLSNRSFETLARCDIMIVSHGHGDHIGEALQLASRFRPYWPAIHEMSLFFGPRMAHGLGGIVGMNKGGTVEHRGIRLSMVRAEHSGGEVREGDHPVYLGEPTGWIVEVENGFRFLFAGDTDVFSDMGLIGERYRPQLAFLPIGGHFTMDPRGAAMAAQYLGVSDIVPMHYGTFPILAGTPTQLREELAARGMSGVTVHELRPGQPFR